MKKKILTLTTAVLLGTSLMGGAASAKTISVQKGDSLWKLSREHQTSVNEIKHFNNLNSNTIYVGQTLMVSKEDSTQNTSVTTNNSVTYIVKKGDTLSKIGRTYGVPYQEIKQWNHLNSNTIYIGQKLLISKPTNSNSVAPAPTNTNTTNSTNVSSSRNELISYAKKFIGTPYKWGGTTPSGFDCSGFMYYTLKSQNLVSSRLSTAGYWSKVKKVSNPQAGDLIFFQGTYKSGPSHMGIYLGNGQFIHASSDGVQISSTSNSYWKKHFLGYGTTF